MATEVADGPAIASSVKWGRPDAPRIFCNGELQSTMPDATGEGSDVFGSSEVGQRLGAMFFRTKRYFEDQLGLATVE